MNLKDLQLVFEDHIRGGYEHMVTYEVDTGGYSWFGKNPAFSVLTAYGLQFYYDAMRDFSYMDAKITGRTTNWLLD